MKLKTLIICYFLLACSSPKERIPEGILPEKEMASRWKLSQSLVVAILSMRLRQLRKLDQLEIKTEYDDLKIELGSLVKLLKSKARQRNAIEAELKELNTRLSKSEPNHAIY